MVPFKNSRVKIWWNEHLVFPEKKWFRCPLFPMYYAIFEALLILIPIKYSATLINSKWRLLPKIVIFNVAFLGSLQRELNHSMITFKRGSNYEFPRTNFKAFKLIEQVNWDSQQNVNFVMKWMEKHHFLILTIVSFLFLKKRR